MTPATPSPAPQTTPAPAGPASATLARGDLGARIVRLAQVAAAVHAARAAADRQRGHA
jgi:hypothetical protein